MPTALGALTPPTAAELPPRRHWTRADIEFHENSGAFDGQHYELVEGDLINKMGKKRPHYSAVHYTANRLSAVFPTDQILQETPIDVAPHDNPTSHPEPDVLVLRRPLRDIATDYAQPSDIALLVEVADTTVKFDLTTKAALYARAGIAEYWVLDVAGRRLIVHRQPESGIYASVVAYDAAESLAPLAAPGQMISVAGLLD